MITITEDIARECANRTAIETFFGGVYKSSDIVLINEVLNEPDNYHEYISDISALDEAELFIWEPFEYYTVGEIKTNIDSVTDRFVTLLMGGESV